ncbi:MAG: hypothetical protein KF893_22500, partial [Caldilineaceae bacterium]|nr:hypothetical protein [Caldilineaceae bacterium]
MSDSDTLLSPETLFEQFLATTNAQELFSLILTTPEATLDELEEYAADQLAAADGDDAVAAIRERLDSLRSLRGEGREAMHAFAEAMQAGLARAQALAELLVEWIRTPDWNASEHYLEQHADELLTDAGESALALLQEANPGNNDIAMHIALLRHCRAEGIAAAYAHLRQQMQEARAAAQALGQNPLLQQVIAFIRAGDAEAGSLLAAERGLLRSVDARGLLEQLLQTARHSDDADVVARIEARLALWTESWRAGRPAPRRPAADPDWQEQPHPQPVDLPGRETLSGQPGIRYVVVNNRGAVGDYAQVINLYNLDLPLRWKRPDQTRADLARGAVGRAAELDELHRRLSRGEDAALVSLGTATALRGQPGIGKTVLAAMYATRYGDDYPGGVLWLEVGPRLRSRDSVTPLLQQMARPAYDANLAADLLENVVFSAEAVAALLGGHGAMLIVLDDVWSEEVVAELKAAAPADASLLLTTRDYDVAFALEKRDDAIQRLDVLSQADARLLLHSKVPHLDNGLAADLAAGLGCHAQALTLAAGALNRRGGGRHAQTVTEIVEAVRLGRNFGDLPRMDKADRVNEVEVALRYSYDYVGEGNGGSGRQAALRSLGSLAQEADFDTGVCAALWKMDAAAAAELLLLFDGLGLISARLPGAGQNWPEDRWQQHAILRAYSLGMQEAEESLTWAEAHADYYLGVAERAYRAQPRGYDRVARDFAQMAHAFDWWLAQRSTRLLRLRDALNDFMLVRGRSLQLGHWSQAALTLADQVGDRGRKANTL